jgi:mannosyltransferase
MVNQTRRGPLDGLAVALPAILAALLCAYRLGDRSLWLDEGASVSIASQHGAALWHGIAHDGGNMLIYYLALHVVIQLLGDGEVALRVMSLLADTATAGLVGLLALQLFHRREVALVAGLLSAVSVSLVFWGQDARGYAAMVTATAASFYALVVLLNPARADGPPSPPAVIAYVVATAGALYLGFDAVLVLPAQLLLAWMLGRRLRVVISSLLVVGLLCVPLLVLAVNRGSGQLFWVPPLSVTVLSQTLVALLSAGMTPNFHTTAITVAGTVAGAAVTLLAFVVAWRSRALSRASAGPGGGSPLMVPVLWLVVPAVVGVAASAAGEPVELARTAILLMPALSLLSAWVLVGPREGASAASGRLSGPRVMSAGGAGMLILLLGLRVAALVPTYYETPEPWKQAAARVLAASRSGDCVAFYPQDGHMPFGYYVLRTPGAAARAPRSVLPAQPWSKLTPHVEQYVLPGPGGVSALTRGCERLWLVSSHQGQQHGTPQSRRNYAGSETIQRELGAVYGRAARSRYGYASAVNVTLYSR